MKKEVIIPDEIKDDKIAGFFYREIKRIRNVDSEQESLFKFHCSLASEFLRSSDQNPASADELSPVVNCYFSSFGERFDMDLVKEFYSRIKPLLPARNSML